MAKWAEPPEVKLKNLSGVMKQLGLKSAADECPYCKVENGNEHLSICPVSRNIRRAEEENDGYAALRYVLKMALEQASVGKGKERHATDKPFDRQPMLEIGRMVGPGFCLGQAIKKAQEASRMEPDAAQRELLGAINYLAGAYLLLEEIEAT
jgi:hypothetical protein